MQRDTNSQPWLPFIGGAERHRLFSWLFSWSLYPSTSLNQKCSVTTPQEGQLAWGTPGKFLARQQHLFRFPKAGSQTVRRHQPRSGPACPLVFTLLGLPLPTGLGLIVGVERNGGEGPVLHHLGRAKSTGMERTTQPGPP